MLSKLWLPMNYYLLFSSFFTIISCTTSRASCVTSRGPAAGQPCVFPFTWDGATCYTCADWIYGGQPAGTKWCSTKTDRNGNHVNGQGNYGFCPDTCSSTGTRIRSNPSTTSTGPCPAPIGINTPAGCNKRFVEDNNGDVPCRDDEDCPQNLNWWIENGGYKEAGQLFGYCQDSKCVYLTDPCRGGGEPKLREYGILQEEQNCCDLFYLRCGVCDTSPPCAAFGLKPIIVSPTAVVSVKKSCKTCEKTSCPPNKPCGSSGMCSRPKCNRRGRCWCLKLVEGFGGFRK